MPTDLMPPAAIAASAGVLLLRHAWGQPHRLPLLNGLAWAVLLAAAIASMWVAGAWGLSMVALAAMATALVVLAVAASMAPAGKPVRAIQRRATDTPKGSTVGQKLLTLLLTGIAPMVAALCVALALRVMADGAGWSAANSNVLCLLMMPVLWAGLTFWLLMTGSTRQRIIVLAGTIASGAAIMGIGSMT